jgi:hypothetical protein
MLMKEKWRRCVDAKDKIGWVVIGDGTTCKMSGQIAQERDIYAIGFRG